MKLNLIILCCILQLIAGAKVPNHKIEARSISPRIRGGKDAAEGQAPFQCSVQKRIGGHICGCAIISTEWIVTAAHCLEGEGPSQVRIVVGTNQWRSGVKYAAREFIIHDHFDSPRYAYDIGLIRVRTPIVFNEKVQPIKLSTKEVPAGASLQTTGWGRLEANVVATDNLQVLNVTSITFEECRRVVTVAHESHLCTKSPYGEGVCHGDSGGPLVYENELVGVVNFGVPCGEGVPDVFGKISYFYDWIQMKIETKPNPGPNHASTQHYFN